MAKFSSKISLTFFCGISVIINFVILRSFGATVVSLSKIKYDDNVEKSAVG